jgi:hypothetical protein
MLAVEFASRHGLAWGRDVVFTYGPYHYLATRLFDPATFWLVLAYDAFSVIAILWIAIERRSKVGLLCLTASLLALQATAPGAGYSLQQGDALLAVTMFGVFLINLEARNPTRLLLIALCGPLALAKTSLALIILPLAILGDLHWMARGRWPVQVLALAGGTLAAWLAAGQQLDGLADYVSTGVQMVGGYGRAMQREGLPLELWSALVACASTLAFGALLVGRSILRAREPVWRVLNPLAAYLGLAWVVFVLFKAGFVRHDYHSVTFDLGAPAALAVFFAYFDERAGHVRASRVTAVIIIGGLLFMGATWKAAVTPGPRGHSYDLFTNIGPRFVTGAGWATGRRFAPASAMRTRADAALKRPFPAVVTGRTDVIPFEISELISSGLDYHSRPVIQSYSSYTPRLQALDRAFLDGPNAPDTLLVRVADIDGRLPTLALGPSFLVVARHYDVVGEDPLGEILRRRPVPRTATPLGTTPERLLPMGQWVALPTAPHTLVIAKIKVSRTLAGRAVGLIYREPIMGIELRASDGTQTTYRFVPDMAVLGAVVSPDPGHLRLADPFAQKPIVAVRLIAGRGTYAFKSATVRFESVSYDPRT